MGILYLLIKIIFFLLFKKFVFIRLNLFFLFVEGGGFFGSILDWVLGGFCILFYYFVFFGLFNREGLVFGSMVLGDVRKILLFILIVSVRYLGLGRL